MNKEETELMRSAEVRKLFGIARSTLSGWKARGIVKAVEVGGLDFYRRAEIKQLFERQAQSSAEAEQK